MSSPTVTPAVSEPLLPTGAIVVIAVGGYVTLIVIALIIRQCLLSRGFCGECCSGGCCSKDEEEAGCCECWMAFAECCNPNAPSMKTCLDSMCPRQKGCGDCDCACACQPPECETINFLCFEVRLK
uniref:Uncharacterized protein n=1 Tax=Branchiostoma floridae TaxID=7739 RepID=C3YCS3_BRAFL|eukprot:XP_002605864.1 hypothetical protein BRAFLDRAFT_90817 [Branchiostoma floridae]